MVFIQQILASSQLTTSIHWSCYCYIHVYVVIYFWDTKKCSMWYYLAEANLCWFFIVCLNIYCCWRSSYKEGRVGIPLTVSVPSQDLHFQRHTWSFLFSEFSWDERGLFILLELVELNDNHCFNSFHNGLIYWWRKDRWGYTTLSLKYNFSDTAKSEGKYIFL